MPDYAWFRTEDGREVYRRVDTGTPVARSSLPCPMIISDQMEPTQSMADGKIYTSKRAISAATRAAGCIEIGNEKIPPRVKPRPDRKAIKDSVQKAVARYKRGERAKA